MDSPFLILKVGGSLFSDKHTNREVCTNSMNQYADLLAALYLELPGRLIFVSGGGSFGHEAVRSMSGQDVSERVDLSVANFRLKEMWHQLLRERGVRSFPVQLAVNATYSSSKALVLNQFHLNRFFLGGYLPVLSGDCFVDELGELHIVGSDQVAGACQQASSPNAKIIMLTDVPGVLGADSDCSRETVKTINQYSDLDKIIWRAHPGDTSNAMRGKVEALLTHAKCGAECIVMRGSDCLNDPLMLSLPTDSWSERIRYTHIEWQQEELLELERAE